MHLHPPALHRRGRFLQLRAGEQQIAAHSLLLQVVAAAAQLRRTRLERAPRSPAQLRQRPGARTQLERRPRGGLLGALGGGRGGVGGDLVVSPPKRRLPPPGQGFFSAKHQGGEGLAERTEVGRGGLLGPG